MPCLEFGQNAKFFFEKYIIRCNGKYNREGHRDQRRGQMSSLLKLLIPVQDTVHVLLVLVLSGSLRFGDT